MITEKKEDKKKLKMKNKKTKIIILASILITLAVTTSLTVYFTIRETTPEPTVSYELNDFLIISLPSNHDHYMASYEQSIFYDDVYFIDIVYNVKPPSSIVILESLTTYTIEINFLFFNYSSCVPDLVRSDFNVYFDKNYFYEKILDFTFDYLELQIKIYVEE